MSTAGPTRPTNERIAYHNGRYLPESAVLIPFRDRGFIYGDAAFDTTRSFGHRLFEVEAHIERLLRSLRYLRIDPGLTAAALAAVTREVFERNRHLLGADDDYWVTQRVSRGLKAVPDGPFEEEGPTVIVECQPLPLRERATLFRDGIRVVTPAVRRTPPASLTPRAKTQNYLNLIVADQEAQGRDPGAWAVLLDTDGNLAEGLGSNLFLVEDGALATPRERNVLPGVSRATVMRLAADAGIACREADLDLYDAYNADECFLTSTSLCVCPVASINGNPVGSGSGDPGPVTRRLIDAYAALVGLDFVGQYLRRLA